MKKDAYPDWVSILLSKDIQSLVPVDKIQDYYLIKRKIAWGPDGTVNDITASTPLPVTDASTQTDINAFAAQNHTDLTQIDTDLKAFESANHADLVTVQGKQDTGNASLASMDGKLADNFGSATNALRTAAQLGNPTGGADFNSGNTSAQTVRTASNLYAYNVGNLIQPLQTDYRGRLRISPIDPASFDTQAVLSRISQVQARFDLSLASNNVTTSTSGGGTVTQATGLLTVQSSTAVTATAIVFTNVSVIYSPGREIYAIFTAAFTSPTNVNSEQRAGYYDTSNGFFLGYHGITFGVTLRNGGVDTFTAQASWNGDPLDGSATSRFTRGGIPEAINYTLLNIYRIRFGWLGSAPIVFEVLSPDGHWVVMTSIRQPNLAAVPSIQNPSLPIRMEVTKTSSDATNLKILTGSWDAGTVEEPAGVPIENQKGRVYKTAQANAQTTSQSVYAVSTGRILRITTLYISVANSSIATTGTLQVTDGNGGTILFPMTIPTSTNQSSAGNNVSIIFPTPLRFSNAVYVNLAAGTLTFSLMFNGYESYQ